MLLHLENYLRWLDLPHSAFTLITLADPKSMAWLQKPHRPPTSTLLRTQREQTPDSHLIHITDTREADERDKVPGHRTSRDSDGTPNGKLDALGNPIDEQDIRRQRASEAMLQASAQIFAAQQANKPQVSNTN